MAVPAKVERNGKIIDGVIEGKTYRQLAKEHGISVSRVRGIWVSFLWFCRFGHA